jgi:hydrogenase expression/formation protein HypD
MTLWERFRDPAAARRLVAEIKAMSSETIRIMEFCGGHTHAIMRHGLRQALAPQVQLLSGPGCPVCVTAMADIDAAIALAFEPGVTLATFGDMLRVPGSRGSLMGARAQGADVRVVYSTLDALELARREPSRQVVMLGIGFETTAPTIAASIEQAQVEGVANYAVLSWHKLTPPAMRAILDAGEVRVGAVLGPGHVTAITGAAAWEFLPRDYGVPCAVAGFEPLDILHAVAALVQCQVERRPRVINAYSRGVTTPGNRVAQALLERVFVPVAARWRGLGEIPRSGLALADAFARYDAHRQFGDVLSAAESQAQELGGCRCGEVLRGVIEPPECDLYRRACTPEHPIGPCMVSGEGACAAHYHYGDSLT